MSKTIIDYKDGVIEEARSFKENLDKLTKDYDGSMFIDGCEIKVNEVPMASFKYLTDGSAVHMEAYDVDAGTFCLVYRCSFAGSFWITFSSVEIPQKADS